MKRPDQAAERMLSASRSTRARGSSMRATVPANVRDLLASPERCAAMGRSAQATVRAHQGATERTAEALLGILASRPALGHRDA